MKAHLEVMLAYYEKLIERQHKPYGYNRCRRCKYKQRHLKAHWRVVNNFQLLHWKRVAIMRLIDDSI